MEVLRSNSVHLKGQAHSNRSTKKSIYDSCTSPGSSVFDRTAVAWTSVVAMGSMVRRKNYERMREKLNRDKNVFSRAGSVIFFRS